MLFLNKVNILFTLMNSSKKNIMCDTKGSENNCVQVHILYNKLIK